MWFKGVGDHAQAPLVGQRVEQIFQRPVNSRRVDLPEGGNLVLGEVPRPAHVFGESVRSGSGTGMRSPTSSTGPLRAMICRPGVGRSPISASSSI
jgi:hypothetical protein